MGFTLDKDTILSVIIYLSSIANDYYAPFEDMLFGGTEKEILDRKTDWCADIARVCCVILQCLDIPCRIVHLVNKEKAYNGHVICEAYYEGNYGAIDPLYGILCYKDRPLNVYELIYNQEELSLTNHNFLYKYDAASINEYNSCDSKNNYSISKPNKYYLTLISTIHHNKWIMNEDK